MAIFSYKARSRKGDRTEGSVDAADRRHAMQQIEAMGLVPISVAEGSVTAATKKTSSGRRFKLSSSRRKMSQRDVLIFTTELSDLLASGMTLGNALNTLANRKTDTINDRIIAELRDAILRGSSLSEAFAQHPATFPPLYVNMIRAGEESGALTEVLRRLVLHFERVQDTKEKVVMALVYPMIVLVLGFATMVFSLIFVIPKFQSIFDDLNATLPLPTRILIGTSSWLVRYGLFAAIGVVIAFILVNRAIKTPRGQLWWHGVLLKAPFVRGVIACSIYANFAHTLATLLGNGVHVLKALGIVEETVGNAVIARELHNARDRVTDGATISGPLAAGNVLPRMMTDMLAIGEQTGDLGSALKHIARRYENELDRNIKIFTTALEPILIVFVALMVGFVAISILMAVFSMTNNLGA